MARFLFLLCGVLSSSLTIAAKQKRAEKWPYSSFQTGEWEPPHLSLLKVGNNIDPGKIFLNVRNYNLKHGTTPTIYDNNGDMVWQGPHEKTMDFKMQRLFGQDVLTYWDGETGVLGYGYGQVHILDNTYEEIHTITLQDDFITPNGQPRKSYIDVHEHLITPRNTIIVSAINITQTNLSGLRDGREDIPLQMGCSGTCEKDPSFSVEASFMGRYEPGGSMDGYHMNSVTPTNDGYLVDIRFFWSAFYLNKDGSVRWQLSGAKGDGHFKTTDVRFSWQHDARVYNESDRGLVLSLFNNAANRASTGTCTTGMAINVDLVNVTATMIYNLTDPCDQVITKTQGSFQFLNYPETGHLFLGYGSVCKVKEYDVDGNVVLAGQFGDIGHAQSYRAFKYFWHAIPHWPPKIVVKRSTTNYTTDVYMSWNGATDHNNWAIMAVPPINSTMEQATILATRDRIGFETHIALENTYAPYIMAVARQVEKVLRSSPVVRFMS